MVKNEVFIIHRLLKLKVIKTSITKIRVVLSQSPTPLSHGFIDREKLRVIPLLHMKHEELSELMLNLF